MITLTGREVVVLLAMVQLINPSEITDSEVKSVYWKAMSMIERKTDGTTNVCSFKMVP